MNLELYSWPTVHLFLVLCAFKKTANKYWPCQLTACNRTRGRSRDNWERRHHAEIREQKEWMLHWFFLHHRRGQRGPTRGQNASQRWDGGTVTEQSTQLAAGDLCYPKCTLSCTLLTPGKLSWKWKFVFDVRWPAFGQSSMLASSEPKVATW